MDTTMSIYAHVIEEADKKSATHLIASLIQKQGTDILKNKSAPKPCFEASYEPMFQITKEPEILYLIRVSGSFNSTSQERFELPTDGLEDRCSILLRTTGT